MQWFTATLLPALGIANKRGLGKTRRVKVEYLWIQDVVENKELEIGEVGTLENPVDILTKILASDAFSEHAQRLSFVLKDWEEQRGQSGPRL